MKKTILLSLLLSVVSFTIKAQVKIGNNPTAINGGSVLEIESTNKGLLFTRVSLSSTTSWSLAGTAVNGMMVYNTNASITQGSTAYPTIKGGKGMYYWDGIGWVTMKFEAGSTLQYGAGAPTGSCSGDVIYVDTSETSITEGQTWTCSGGAWIAYTPKNGTEWMFGNSTNDAGADKVAKVWRKGYIGISPKSVKFSPSATLHVLNDGDIDGNQDNIVIESYNNTSTTPRYYGIVGKGTFASPSYIEDEQELVALAGKSKLSTTLDGLISIRADGNQSANNFPTKISFWTRPKNSTSSSLQRMIIKENGYVGINTVDPQSILHINSNADCAIRGIGSGTSNGIIFVGETNGARIMIDQNEIMAAANNSAGGALLINGPPQDNGALSTFSAGNVSIGYNQPNDNYALQIQSANNKVISLGDFQANANAATVGNMVVGSSLANAGAHAKLDVNGWNYTNVSAGKYFGSASTTLQSWSGGDRFLSIWASHAITAPSFYAYSDKRIKNNIKSTTTSNELSFINKINIVNYNYIDNIQNGNELQKGVIAQEIEKIAPEAITTLTDFIPNVYAVSTKAIENKEKNTLTVTVAKPIEFKVGDLVKLISNDKEKSYEVIAVNGDNQFTVKDWEETLNDGRVFVYGKQVNDYKSVNYDYLFTANIAATQELYKMIIDLQNENAKLKTEMSNVNSLQGQLDVIRAQLDALVPNNKLSEK